MTGRPPIARLAIARLILAGRLTATGRYRSSIYGIARLLGLTRTRLPGLDSHITSWVITDQAEAWAIAELAQDRAQRIANQERHQARRQHRKLHRCAEVA